MQEPVAIPVRDLTSDVEASDHVTSERSVAGAATELVTQLLTAGASVALSVIDDAGDDELRELAAAGAGFVIEGCRALGAAATTIERGMAAPAAAAARAPVVGDLLAHWESVWTRAAMDRPALEEAMRRALEAILERIDLTELIRTHVDLQAIARDVDFNALVEGVDVDALADRLDISALARRIDVNELAGRIDVDALAGRIDLDTLIERLDLARIASEVIEELDLADLVRDAAAETTSEGVRTVRLRGVDADRAIRRAVDRILSRRDGSAS